MANPRSRSASRRCLSTGLLLVAVAAACSSSPAARSGQIEHVVLVWLKQPDDQAVADRMCATARSFPGRIPGLLSVNCGKAVPSDSPLADDSFDLGLVMRFADRQALDGYAVHPVHQQAVAEVLMPNSKRVVVYDVQVQ